MLRTGLVVNFSDLSKKFLIFVFSLGLIACSHAEKKEIVTEPPLNNFSESMQVEEVLTNTLLKIKGVNLRQKLLINEKMALVSREKDIGIYGVGIVKKILLNKDGRFDFEFEILALQPKYTVRLDDRVVRLDLTTTNQEYMGRTYSLVHLPDRNISSRYKPLFTQGYSIGETAETLWKNEFLFTYYGQIYYGMYDFLSVGTLLPLNAVGSANGALKARIYRSETNVLAAGLSYTKIPNSQASTLNINFMWDSISNETSITHTFITLAVFSFDKAEDASAIKSLGTSSLQTGYEFIMDSWNRLLVGPNFNFEKKSVGGYLSYLKIWDKTHLQFSLNSTNIRSLKLSPTDGYYAFFDAYWRY